ncbi:hypothetical protein [Brevibacillus brevis]|uniref:hypothetical protein n=1 Tax=Brevibacillus brevis TaxID=1393 RepID=UPI0025A65DFD|nr:hypothetical protein [Brevibacillus brevis]WJQ82792.1 hypothetical protein QN310_06565 [Brevibacillus brevis]
MHQFVDSVTGEIYYTEEVLRRSDEIVKVFRPVGQLKSRKDHSQPEGKATAQKAVTCRGWFFA